MTGCGPDLKVDSDVYRLAWSATEKHIVTLSHDGILQKWNNIFNSATLFTKSVQKHEYARLVYSPDDRFIVTDDFETAKLWDASNLSLLWNYPRRWSSIVFHPLGRRVFLFYRGIVSDINVNIREYGCKTTSPFDFFVYDVAFDSSGKSCVADTDQGIRVLDTDSFEERASLPYNSVKAMRYTPDGKYILLVLKSKKVVLWNVATSTAVKELTLHLDFEIQTAQISKNCRVVVLQTFCILHLMSAYY